MKLDPFSPEKTQISYEILSYLIEHPDSQDTLEGIVQWWWLERKIKHQTIQIKEAVAELVTKEMVLEHKGSDSQTHFRINKRKYEEIRTLLTQKAL